jgi:hypothetical protein
MPAKCSIDPAPDVPYDASFGLALHHWMKSASVLTSRGTSGPTLSTNGKPHTVVTATRSCTGS